jgi:hypothetical protein
MENLQIITSNGLPQFAVLPYREYLELKAKAEGYADVEDYLDYHRAEEVLSKTKDDEWISSEDVERKLGV